MKFLLVLTLTFCLSSFSYSQNEYEPSAEHPYGLPNPNAPAEIKDYQDMIGMCDCISTTRNTDGTWAESNKMTWEFKYIMNGMAVQDQTLKADGAHSGSIRQYIADSTSWYVHYFSASRPSTLISTWEGGNKGDDIVLYKDQTAPNGMEGKYRITFHDINEDGFNWIGEWVSIDESFVYPTWKIGCTKRKE